MRNDARPVGEEAHERSPLDGRQSPDDPRESVTHDRQSPIVNREAEDDQKRTNADAPKSGE